MSASDRGRGPWRLRLLGFALTVILLVGCAPAARSELPREARGAEVQSARLKAAALADDYLRQVTGSAPLYGSLDGCRDLRGGHTGYLWRCTLVRATAISGDDAVTALREQHQRLAADHCSAYPGLATTEARLTQGLAPRFLYDVDYRCPDQMLVTIRFSDPSDPDLGAKLDLGALQYGPGTGNVNSSQSVSEDTVRRLRDDTTQELIMVVSVIRTYWLMPADTV